MSGETTVIYGVGSIPCPVLIYYTIISQYASASAVGERTQALIVWGIRNYIRWRPMKLGNIFFFLFWDFSTFLFLVDVWRKYGGWAVRHEGI
jgi:hypothetical protein